MASPRVLLAFDYFARYTAGLARGMRSNGWSPALAYRQHDHAFGGEAGALDHHLRRALGEEIPRFVVPGRVRDVSALPPAIRASRAIRRWHPDVVHAQYCIPNDPRLGVVLPLRRGAFALTVHDVTTHPGDPRPARHKYLHGRWLIRHAGVIFVHAESLHERLVREFETGAPIVVVPHGTESAELGPLPEQPSLLFFGRLSEYKGLNVLLDALPAVWLSRPDVTLTVAGAGDLATHPVLDDPRVTVVHRHVDDEEVPELFRAASLIVLPYIEASQSGVGSLAKGYGRPLVASAIGGLPELLSDGSGALVEPGSPRELAKQIVALVEDRKLLERHAAAGLRSAEAGSGWTGVAAATIAAYERHLPLENRPRPSSARA